MFEKGGNHYEQWANHYIGEAQLLKLSFCVIVEAEADVQFWGKIFLYLNLSPHFIPYSKNPAGNETTGVAQCLKFKAYASPHFVICIDSDYRYLLREEGISPDKFVFQTYTYSIENHYCHPARFNFVCKTSCSIDNEIFDFHKFSKQYSRRLFSLFLWHIYSIKHQLTYLTKSDFLQIINESHEGVPNCDIEHNAQMILDKLDKSCKDRIRTLETMYPDTDLSTIKSDLSTLGITERNILLYVRGHNVFSLTQKIGTEVTNAILNKEKSKLNQTEIAKLYEQRKPFSDKLKDWNVSNRYPEISRILDDIVKILPYNRP
ncbi:hypothetical protein EZS27_030607 [termite gut metagenome]|uniref:DUF4435 domain-containing protein n=1 Tax=termite gut metagenome TaxID=433724 RepID=A0A5J4QEN2_9ZZZZ